MSYRLPQLIVLAIIVSGLWTATAKAADNTTFNYQGRILVNGTPFNGAGTVKFAIVNTSGTITLWSNDDSSTSGSQPTASLPVQVVNGIFDVLVGDTNVGMSPLKSILFNGRNDLRLRVWFDDSTHGIQKLTPDRIIPNAALLGVRRITEATSIYVSAASGNDANSGLTSGKPKKSIQSAVDMLPAQISNNVTISIANGTYREQVSIGGISAVGGSRVLFLGDQSWTSATVTNPGVRITGSNDDISIVRSSAISAENCSGLQFQGLFINKCVNGVRMANCSTCAVNGIVCTSNSNTGFFCSASQVDFTNGRFNNNLSTGLTITANSSSYLIGKCEFLSNSTIGMEVSTHSTAIFRPDLGYTGKMQANGFYGLWIRYQAQVLNNSTNTISGNGFVNLYTADGGSVY